MKKLISLILAILTLSCAISVVGCGSDVKTYTITLDANGGTVSTKTISIQVGQSYELPTPEMKGFTFKTWMLNSSKIAQKGVWNIESDVNLVAVYEGIKYKVDQNLNLCFATEKDRINAISILKAYLVI